MSEARIYLTVGKTEDGQMLAVASYGQPQLGHAKSTVLAAEVVESKEEADRWFARMLDERPWEPRQ